MESILSLIVLIGLFQLGKAKVEQQAKEREQRLQALEKALANPSIDRATLQQLAQQLTGAKAPKASSSTGLAWLLAIGWITLFTGAGVWSLGYMLGEDDALAGGVVVMLIGFGLVTYPFALRDMESRRSQS
jgi:hypothetical protein